MPEPLAHLYALALRALDEQERRAEALRARLSPVLAAAALGASVLGSPSIGAARPTDIAGALAALIAFAGLTATLATVTYILGTRRAMSFNVKAHRIRHSLDAMGALDDSVLFYDAMIVWLGRLQDRNATTARHIERVFTWMLFSILVTQCGLALTTIVR